MMKLLLIGIFIHLSLICFGQERINEGEEFAKAELERSLADTTFHNTEIIKDKKTAILVAEQILFSGYGQKNIEQQKPYVLYKIKNYWIMSGTLPKKYSRGGTFLIIMDARDCRVIRLTHGK